MTETSECAIWRTPATDFHSDRDGRLIDSPRAGGRYFISSSAEPRLSGLDPLLKARLTTWLVEQRALGASCPEVSSVTIDEATRWGSSSALERADALLKCLSGRSQILGSRIPFRIEIEGAGFFETPLNPWQTTYYELLGHSGCIGSKDFEYLMDHLSHAGLIERYGVNDADQECRLTVGGYARLEALEQKQNASASTRAFVAMWFDPSMQAARDDGIKAAIRLAGYEPVVIDEQEHVGRIDDQIVAEIRRSRFLVADFTHGKTGARGGVYYEVGFAHGLGIPAILTCRNDKVDDLHFDTRQYNHIVWKSPEGLRIQLTRRISAVIGDGPLLPEPVAKGQRSSSS